MILFRSQKSKILLASLALCLFGMAQAFFTSSASTLSSNNVNVDVDVINGVTIHVLDKTATTEITRLDLALEAIPTGSFVSDYFNVDVATSNKTGYKLYMNSNYQDTSTSPATYTTALVNQVDSSATIPTLTANTTKTDFSTAAPGTTNANKWGYSLDDTIYSPIPAHTSSAEIASGDAPTTSTLVPVYIAANVNLDKPSGTYKNQLTFSAIANPIPTDYSLHFLPGTTDTVTDLPSDQTASEVSASHTFTIPSTAPTRTGYNFTGYLDESTSTIYQPGDTITVLGDEEYTGSATLTAQWGLASYTVSITNSNTTSGASSLSVPYGGNKTVTVTPSSGYYLSSVSCPSGYTCSGYSTGTSATGQQTVTVKNDNTTSEGTLGFTGTLVPSMQNQTNINTCKNAATGTAYTLRDERDNNIYTVAKLADGKCWMTQNLRLTGSRTLTPSDSNVSSNWTLPTEKASDFDWGFDCTDTAYHMKSSTDATTYASYGNYYNWYAATAGTGDCAMESGDATSSICPKGWRLPTGGDSGEFQSLYNQYPSSAALRGAPVNIILSGFRHGSITYGQGDYGDYWSSTAITSDYAHELSLISSNVDPASYYYKYRGFTVRCVAR